MSFCQYTLEQNAAWQLAIASDANCVDTETERAKRFSPR